MKIAIINSVMGYGSTGHIVESLMQRIEASGNEAHVFFGYGNTHRKNATRIASGFYTKINILKTRVFGKHAFYSKRATRRLVKNLSAFNPDIIHLEQVHGHYLNVPILFRFLKTFDKPVVWTMHDCWAFTGHCAHYDRIGCEKWKTGCHHCPQLRAYPKSLFFDRSNESWHDKRYFFTLLNRLTLTSPSAWLARQLELSFLCDVPRKIISNGIDLSVFQPASALGLKRSLGIDKQLVVLGMFNKWFDPAISAQTKRFMDAFSKEHVRFVLIGGSADENARLPENATGVGFISSPNALAEYYAMADVFVNLTLADTFPTVNLESLACGTPVITFDSGGSSECVDAKTGIVIKKMDFDALIAVIARLETGALTFEREDCRARAEKHYNHEECSDAIISLYSKIVK